MPCNCCEITESAFGEDSARADIRSYRKRGPAPQTRLILSAIRSLNLRNAALLDIGGGVGAIHHELVGDVAREATHVDASSAYLKEAKAEAARRGIAKAFISFMPTLRMWRIKSPKLTSSRLTASYVATRISAGC